MIRLKDLFGRRSATIHTSLHSIERMQAILNRERMRSDRGKSSFSLLVLAFESRCEDGELATLGRILADRIRITDDAGRLAANQVGVVLPETPVDGAWKLAEDILALLPADLRRPKCDVYVYPTEIEPLEPVTVAAESGTNGHSHNGHSHSDHSHSDHDDHGHNNNGHNNNSNGHGHNGHSHGPRRKNHKAGVGAHACQALEKPMHVLFMQPLPAWKRVIDIVGAGTAIIVLSPLLLAVAAAIKVTSPGPAIFKQKRDTIGGRRFTIYKFRTMSNDAERQKAALRALSEQDGPAFKINKDPRVTRLGRFLRTSSIDELPQLFNVLAGDMTLVGPRAMDSRESDACEQWQRRRLDVTAGLTCIWQVRGRSAVSFAEWMRMDLTYIGSRSLVNDLKLIAETVPAVLLRRGAC